MKILKNEYSECEKLSVVKEKQIAYFGVNTTERYIKTWEIRLWYFGNNILNRRVVVITCKPGEIKRIRSR